MFACCPPRKNGCVQIRSRGPIPRKRCFRSVLNSQAGRERAPACLRCSSEPQISVPNPPSAQISVPTPHGTQIDRTDRPPRNEDSVEPPSPRVLQLQEEDSQDSPRAEHLTWSSHKPDRSGSPFGTDELAAERPNSLDLLGRLPIYRLATCWAITLVQTPIKHRQFQGELPGPSRLQHYFQTRPDTAAEMSPLVQSAFQNGSRRSRDRISLFGTSSGKTNTGTPQRSADTSARCRLVGTCES